MTRRRGNEPRQQPETVADVLRNVRFTHTLAILSIASAFGEDEFNFADIMRVTWPDLFANDFKITVALQRNGYIERTRKARGRDFNRNYWRLTPRAFQIINAASAALGEPETQLSRADQPRSSRRMH